MNETSILSLRSWCCGAPFGQHERTCPNYQPTPEKRVESGEPQKWTCPDCGYTEMPYPPKDYNICPKCMVEFGNDDKASQQTDWAEKEAREWRLAVENALWDQAAGKDYYDAPMSVRREILDISMPLLAALLRRVREEGFKDGQEWMAKSGNV